MQRKFYFPYIGIVKNALLMLFATLAFSCSKDDPTPMPDHQRYYPLQVGMWRIYDVDSVQYWGSTDYPNDTAKFQLKEEIVSTTTDNTGQTVYRIETFQRKNENAPWELKFVSTANINRQRAELWINNSRYVKLIFPVENGDSWDANMFNNEDPDHFERSEYRSVHQSATINNTKFDSVTTIKVLEYKDFIDDVKNYEQYATGIGLVQQNWQELNYQDDKDHPGKKLIRGFIYTKTLNSFGK